MKSMIFTSNLHEDTSLLTSQFITFIILGESKDEYDLCFDGTIRDYFLESYDKSRAVVLHNQNKQNF